MLTCAASAACLSEASLAIRSPRCLSMLSARCWISLSVSETILAWDLARVWIFKNSLSATKRCFESSIMVVSVRIWVECKKAERMPGL